MPTPLCNEKNSQYKGEYCICEFCSFRKECPKSNKLCKCNNCKGPISECDSFDDFVMKEMMEMLEANNKK